MAKGKRQMANGKEEDARLVKGVSWDLTAVLQGLEVAAAAASAALALAAAAIRSAMRWVAEVLALGVRLARVNCRRGTPGMDNHYTDE